MSVQPLHRHERRVAVGDDFGIVFRVLAAIGAAVLVVFSLVALARISWDSNWMDAAPVQVAGVTFTPLVAIGIGVAGVIALLAAASRDRSSKIVVGVVLLCVGVGVLIAQSNSRFTLKAGGNSGRVVLEPAHGWMLLGVGAVLAIAGLVMSWHAERAGVDDEVV